MGEQLTSQVPRETQYPGVCSQQRVPAGQAGPSARRSLSHSARTHDLLSHAHAICEELLQSKAFWQGVPSRGVESKSMRTQGPAARRRRKDEGAVTIPSLLPSVTCTWSLEACDSGGHF